MSVGWPVLGLYTLPISIFCRYLINWGPGSGYVILIDGSVDPAPDPLKIFTDPEHRWLDVRLKIMTKKRSDAILYCVLRNSIPLNKYRYLHSRRQFSARILDVFRRL